jgi:predicted dehydrogenase
MALLDVARAMPAGADYFTLSLIGSSGAAYADDHRDVQLAFRGREATALRGGPGDFHLVAQLSEFLAAIRERREPAVGAADALRAIQVTEVALRSLDSGRAARLVGGAYELA